MTVDDRPDSVSEVSSEVIVGISETIVIVFAEPFIVPELCFESLLLPGDPIPPDSFKITVLNN